MPPYIIEERELAVLINAIIEVIEISGKPG
jgi:adenosylmethionine-8-amino-7-oxononanoate aminotransferase